MTLPRDRPRSEEEVFVCGAADVSPHHDDMQAEPRGCPTPGACSCAEPLQRAARLILHLRGCSESDITPEMIESLIRHELLVLTEEERTRC